MTSAAMPLLQARYGRSSGSVPTVRIVGRAKLREGEEASCEHCGRAIKNVVYLSDGACVGTRCALKALGYTQAQVDRAPFVSRNMDAANGLVTDGRQIFRVVYRHDGAAWVKHLEPVQ